MYRFHKKPGAEAFSDVITNVASKKIKSKAPLLWPDYFSNEKQHLYGLELLLSDIQKFIQIKPGAVYKHELTEPEQKEYNAYSQFSHAAKLFTKGLFSYDNTRELSKKELEEIIDARKDKLISGASEGEILTKNIINEVTTDDWNNIGLILFLSSKRDQLLEADAVNIRGILTTKIHKYAENKISSIKKEIANSDEPTDELKKELQKYEAILKTTFSDNQHSRHALDHGISVTEYINGDPLIILANELFPNLVKKNQNTYETIFNHMVEDNAKNISESLLKLIQGDENLPIKEEKLDKYLRDIFLKNIDIKSKENGQRQAFLSYKDTTGEQQYLAVNTKIKNNTFEDTLLETIYQKVKSNPEILEKIKTPKVIKPEKDNQENFEGEANMGSSRDQISIHEDAKILLERLEKIELEFFKESINNLNKKLGKDFNLITHEKLKEELNSLSNFKFPSDLLNGSEEKPRESIYYNALAIVKEAEKIKEEKRIGHLSQTPAPISPVSIPPAPTPSGPPTKKYQKPPALKPKSKQQKSEPSATLEIDNQSDYNGSTEIPGHIPEADFHKFKQGDDWKIPLLTQNESNISFETNVQSGIIDNTQNKDWNEKHGKIVITVKDPITNEQAVEIANTIKAKMKLNNPTYTIKASADTPEAIEAAIKLLDKCTSASPQIPVSQIIVGEQVLKTRAELESVLMHSKTRGTFDEFPPPTPADGTLSEIFISNIHQLDKNLDNSLSVHDNSFDEKEQGELQRNRGTKKTGPGGGGGS